jgi:two-component sensor histidine kinase
MPVTALPLQEKEDRLDPKSPAGEGAMSLDGLLRRETRTRAAAMMVLLLAGVWCAGALAHLTLTFTLIRLGVRMWPAIYIEAAVAGAIAALLVGAVLVMVLYRRETLRRQLLVVAELNHQVRNALEIIASSTSRIADKKTVVTILDAVMRIDVTLRSLFPVERPLKKTAASSK